MDSIEVLVRRHVHNTYYNKLRFPSGFSLFFFINTFYRVAGIWWAIPIGWALADIVGYYKLKDIDSANLIH